MKAVACGLFVVITMLGCGGDGAGNGSDAGYTSDTGSLGDGGADTGTSVIVSDIKATDNQGQDLGIVLSADEYILVVFSPKGHIYWLQWDGKLRTTENFGYSGDNCTGDTFLFTTAEMAALTMSPIAVFYDLQSDRLMEPAETTSSPHDIRSYSQNSSLCTASIVAGVLCYEAREITHEAAGIPNVIVPPITLKQ